MYTLARIKRLKYTPLLCKELDVFDFDEFSRALSTDATFILAIDKNQLAISW